MKDLKAAYKTIEADHFAPKMEISFIEGVKHNNPCGAKGAGVKITRSKSIGFLLKGAFADLQ